MRLSIEPLFLLRIAVLSLLVAVLLSHFDAPGPVPTDLRHMSSSTQFVFKRGVVGRILHRIRGARHLPQPKLLTKTPPKGYT